MNKADPGFNLFVAPLQGFTESPWRHGHASVYGHAVGEVEYFTPFLRVEKGEVRRRDIRELSSPLNNNHILTPQALFRDVEELRMIVEVIVAVGYDRLDLNLGCPFPPQWHKGRGAGLLIRPGVLAEIAEYIDSVPEISFSVKMRLGLDDPTEWRRIMPIINKMRLRHLTMHPRIARQEYSGEPYWSEFLWLVKSTPHRVVVNGDIASVERILELRDSFPAIHGVMVGRGLLARPSLYRELIDGRQMGRDERLRLLLQFHSFIFDQYCSALCGDSQILNKIKPFWLYLEGEIGRKSWKAIKKSISLTAYREAVKSIG